MNDGRVARRAFALAGSQVAMQLREDLYYCRVNGRTVFMDVENDTYFVLRDKLERIFGEYVNDRRVPQADLDALLAHGILAEDQATDPRPPHVSLPAPSRSVAEEIPSRRPPGWKTVFEVARTTYRTRARLRRQRFSQVVREHLAYCGSKVPARATGDPEVTGTRLMDAVSEYACARRYVPIEASCLLDSLSMQRFLARRRLHANMVFGVTLEPFSAHAWLQAGDLALNELASYACTHTPILIL